MKEHDAKANYLRFLAMIATSMAVMFVLMYLNSYRIIDHARFSETRAYMSLIMGGSMVIVMLSYMLGMYSNKKWNAALFATGVLMLLAGLALVRSQIAVTDVDYMQGMIPHHSIAILTSERAQIEDPRVRRLADEIIEAQVREISEMEWLIDDIRQHGLALTPEDAAARPVPEFGASSQAREK
ncbi:MAG: DUF305 domain-containing protein [Gammaproteobacteria bacterium]